MKQEMEEELSVDELEWNDTDNIVITNTSSIDSTHNVEDTSVNKEIVDDEDDRNSFVSVKEEPLEIVEDIYVET